MWRVVHFLTEQTVSAVPVQWVISENSCQWPTLTGLRLRTAISKCQSPDESWPSYSCRILGEIYGDLSTARMKSLQAEEESDLNSDYVEAGFGHRKAVRNKKYDSDLSQMETDIVQKNKKRSSSEETESDEVSHESLKIPILKINNRSSNISKSFLKSFVENELPI